MTSTRPTGWLEALEVDSVTTISSLDSVVPSWALFIAIHCKSMGNLRVGSSYSITLRSVGRSVDWLSVVDVFNLSSGLFIHTMRSGRLVGGICRT